MAGQMFTVVIATYDRGEAIAATLRSVQRQTHEDFEVLVVSDGPPAKGLAETVASFGDRFRLMQTPVRTGSQSGPHNFALANAAGTWIAYLSHDDMWLPDHLASLAGVYENSENAQFAVSGCLFLGPPGRVDELSEVTGVYYSEDPSVPASHYFPPSSVSHLRELPGESLAWPVEENPTSPPDSAFQLAAVAQGRVFASTGRVTVFKFASSLRYLSYLSSSAAEQEQVEAIIADEAVRKDYLAERLKVAGEHGNVMRRMHPGPDHDWKDESLRRRILRGLDVGTPSPFTESVWLAAGSDERGHDWYPQSDDGVQKFRWSGPSPSPRLAIPRSAGGPAHVRIHLYGDAGQPAGQVLGVTLDGAEQDFAVLSGPYGSKIEILARLRPERASVLQITTTLAPDEADPTRQVGIPLVGIDIETMAAAAIHPNTPGESRAALAVRAAHNEGLVQRTKELTAAAETHAEELAKATARAAELEAEVARLGEEAEAAAAEWTEKLETAEKRIFDLGNEREDMAERYVAERSRVKELEKELAAAKAGQEESSGSGGGLFGRRRK